MTGVQMSVTQLCEVLRDLGFRPELVGAALDRAGFWESWEHGGYHMRGDPWQEERHQAE